MSDLVKCGLSTLPEIWATVLAGSTSVCEALKQVTPAELRHCTPSSSTAVQLAPLFGSVTLSYKMVKCVSMLQSMQCDGLQ